MLAERAYSMWVDLELHLITPEASPLALFGAEASREVAALLDRGQDRAAHGAHAELVGARPDPAGAGRAGSLEVDRIVTLPRLQGPAIPGLPADHEGFLVHRRPRPRPGRRRRLRRRRHHAFPIKQGGIACQQADAAAARHRGPRRRAGEAGAVRAGAARDAADGALGALHAPRGTRCGRRIRGRGPRAVVAAGEDRRSRARRLPGGPRRAAGRRRAPVNVASATRGSRDRSPEPADSSTACVVSNSTWRRCSTACWRRPPR